LIDASFDPNFDPSFPSQYSVDLQADKDGMLGRTCFDSDGMEEDYSNSTLYNYVKKAEDLLPDTFDISPEQLLNAMTTSYNLDNKMANDVVHEIMSNDKNVEELQNSYIKDIRIRRKRL